MMKSRRNLSFKKECQTSKQQSNQAKRIFIKYKLHITNSEQPHNSQTEYLTPTGMTKHRWENGAAGDFPPREARLKALFLKEQAAWEHGVTIPLVKVKAHRSSSTNNAMVPRRHGSARLPGRYSSFPSYDCSFQTSLNEPVSHSFPTDRPASPPTRSLSPSWRHRARAA
jgi:hypothetical protein